VPSILILEEGGLPSRLYPLQYVVSERLQGVYIQCLCVGDKWPELSFHGLVFDHYEKVPKKNLIINYLFVCLFDPN